jgi:peptidoglycan/xylan/chitin deacetylase (PgdA/CDA1 family)
MKKRIGIFVLSIIVIIGFAYALFQISKLRSFQFFGGLTHRVETQEKVVALTFDDAPTPYTEDVLQILEEKQIPATFYLIGKNIEQHPDIAKRIVELGHEVGNHSYSHPRFVLKSWATIDQEIQSTQTLIRDTGYTGEITFRPPTGKKLFALPLYLKQHGIKTIMWDVEPDTYVAGDADAIMRYTLENTTPGSIILMHPFCEIQCAADRIALPQIIDDLLAQGYTFLTVSELLKSK